MACPDANATAPRRFAAARGKERRRGSAANATWTAEVLPREEPQAGRARGVGNSPGGREGTHRVGIRFRVAARGHEQAISLFGWIKSLRSRSVCAGAKLAVVDANSTKTGDAPPGVAGQGKETSSTQLSARPRALICLALQTEARWRVCDCSARTDRSKSSVNARMGRPASKQPGDDFDAEESERDVEATRRTGAGSRR